MKVFIDALIRCNYCRAELVPSKTVKETEHRIMEHPYADDSLCPHDGKVVRMPLFEAQEHGLLAARPGDWMAE